MQGVLGCSMHLSQRGNVHSGWRLPVVWQRDCLWMQSWVGVPVDTTSSSLTAGLMGTCQGGGGRHGAPVAHPGSCKAKPCMTGLVVLHITVCTSACNTVYCSAINSATLTAVTAVSGIDLPCRTEHSWDIRT